MSKFYLILLILFFENALTRKILTDLQRKPEWMRLEGGFDPIKQGPFYGQPEQVHISYGGM